MSAKKDLYLAVKEKLTTGENPTVKHCRLFNDQFNQMNIEDSYLFPCVFIEFVQLDWLAKSEGLQEAETLLRLHVGFESLKTEEMEIFDLVEKIHETLQGFTIGDKFTPFNRRQELQDINHDNVIVWIMDYETLLTDNAGNRNAKLVQTTITDVCLDRELSPPRLRELRP